MRTLLSVIETTLQLYEQRAEFDGTLKSARECLELAEYEWRPDIAQAAAEVVADWKRVS